jgi:hypothetical protein
VNEKTNEELIKELKEKEKPHTIYKAVEMYVIPSLHLITAILVGIVAFMSFKAMERNNRIIDTANLLVIYDAIQTRMDTLSSLTIEFEAMEILYKDQKIEDKKPLEELKRRKDNAIISFLNTFEFACLQYENNKIDKEAFKLFYNDDAFKALLKRHDDRITDRDCPNITNVLERWKRESDSQ